MSQNPERLVEQASLRDEEAIEVLLEKHLPTVRAIVTHRMRKILRTREESLDLVQSACRRALEQRDHYETRDENQFQAWLLKIVENKLVDRYRELMALKRGHDLQADASERRELEGHAASTEEMTPSFFAQRNETIAVVRRAMEELPQDLQEALEGHEFDGLSYEKLAERHGITPKQARLRVTKAKVQLARILGRLERDAAEDLPERG